MDAGFPHRTLSSVLGLCLHKTLEKHPYTVLEDDFPALTNKAEVIGALNAVFATSQGGNEGGEDLVEIWRAGAL